MVWGSNPYFSCIIGIYSVHPNLRIYSKNLGFGRSENGEFKMEGTGRKKNGDKRKVLFG